MFKPRQFKNEPSLASVIHSFADSTSDSILSTSLPNATTYAGWELTKNDKYCVTRLPALPSLLESNMDEDLEEENILNGYTDNFTNFAVVVGQKAINAWPYRSTDSSPITFEFPIAGVQSEGLTLAILTRPSRSVDLDPGLVVIETIAGKVRYYESVQFAPALGLMNNDGTEVSVGLKNGEFITYAENIEPLGVVVATNWKRVVLVTLRDVQGRAHLNTVELTSHLKASRLLSLFSSSTGAAESGNEIVSVKLGKVVNGLEWEIIIQDSRGTFRNLTLQYAASGQPFIDHRKTVQYNLTPYLENNIDGVIPGTLIQLRFFGICKLEVSGVPNLYTALVGVENAVNGQDEKRLLLVTMKVDQSGVLLYGSHQLPPVQSFDTKPQLFIPKPYTTAFVAAGNSVTMTDMNTTFLQQNASGEPTFSYYKPQWEDTIKLKSNVEVIGLGYEDMVTKLSNAALILITNNYGVLRVEKFPSTPKPNTQLGDPTDPVVLLKSHMQQAIFYSQSEAIDFNVDPLYLLEVVQEATSSIIKEVLNSLTASLPPLFSSTRDSLLTRSNALRELVLFVQQNFGEFWFRVVPQIVEAIEKLDVAQQIWALLDAGSPESALLKDKVISIIQEHKLVPKSGDIARSFFTYETDKIDQLASRFLKVLKQSSHSDRVMVKVLVGILYEGILKNEARYLAELPEIAPAKNWSLRLDLFEESASAFEKLFKAPHGLYDVVSAQDRLSLVSLCEAFYYITTRLIQALQDDDDAELDSYVKWYRVNRKYWISAMLKAGLIEEALAISEKFQDYSSLAYIIENAREQYSKEVTEQRIRQYIDAHGYEFASKLFEFYIKTGQIQRLLLDFEDRSEYLDEFFAVNSRKFDQISWIHYLRKEDFESASKILGALASKKETDDQEKRELSLSLAKLTAVAAKIYQPASSNAIDLEESIIETENNLVAVRIQNFLHSTISHHVQDKKELITLDYFMHNFVNSKLQDLVESNLSMFFERFVELRVLAKDELIELLTAIKPVGQLKRVYVDAFKVAQSIGNDTRFREQAQKIWWRLLGATDNWEKIMSTSENTDEINKARVHELVLFYTLSQLDSLEDLYRILDEGLRNVENGGSHASNRIEGEVERLTKEKSLRPWVESIKAEVLNLTR